MAFGWAGALVLGARTLRAASALLPTPVPFAETSVEKVPAQLAMEFRAPAFPTLHR